MAKAAYLWHGAPLRQITMGSTKHDGGAIACVDYCCPSDSTPSVITCGNCGLLGIQGEQVILTVPSNSMTNKSPVCSYYDGCGCDTLAGEWTLPWEGDPGGCSYVWQDAEYCEVWGYGNYYVALKMLVYYSQDNGSHMQYVQNGFWTAMIQIGTYCGVGSGGWGRVGIWETSKESFTLSDPQCPWADEDGVMTLTLTDSFTEPWYEFDLCNNSWPSSLELELEVA
jgi:hypothetical protein